MPPSARRRPTSPAWRRATGTPRTTPQPRTRRSRNYLELFSGSTQGVTDDKSHELTGPSLADQLTARGSTWRLYAENFPARASRAGFLDGADGKGDDPRKQNPAISFTAISGNPARCANITDFSQFDLAASDVGLHHPKPVPRHARLPDCSWRRMGEALSGTPHRESRHARRRPVRHVRRGARRPGEPHRDDRRLAAARRAGHLGQAIRACQPAAHDRGAATACPASPTPAGPSRCPTSCRPARSPPVARRGVQLVHLTEHERRDAELSAQPPRLLGELVEGTDPDVRGGAEVLLVGTGARPRADLVGRFSQRAVSVVGEARRDARRIDVELEVAEPLAGRVAHPADLLDRRRPRQARVVAAPVAPGTRRQADDLRLAGGELEHPAPPPPIISGGCGRCTGFGWPSSSVIV